MQSKHGIYQPRKVLTKHGCFFLYWVMLTCAIIKSLQTFLFSISSTFYNANPKLLVNRQWSWTLWSSSLVTSGTVARHSLQIVLLILHQDKQNCKKLAWQRYAFLQKSQSWKLFKAQWLWWVVRVPVLFNRLNTSYFIVHNLYAMVELTPGLYLFSCLWKRKFSRISASKPVSSYAVSLKVHLLTANGRPHGDFSKSYS